jgi:hypothetical protein
MHGATIKKNGYCCVQQCITDIKLLVDSSRIYAVTRKTKEERLECPIV